MRFSSPLNESSAGDEGRCTASTAWHQRLDEFFGMTGPMLAGNSRVNGVTEV